MTSPKGRRTSRVRTPALIRDYLAGEPGPAGPWPGDTDAERVARPAQGDYYGRMHQRVKAYIREYAPRGNKAVYPRRASFVSLVNVLLGLGLLERTGAQAEPQGRGAGQLGTAGGFAQRTWVRLGPGSASDPRWHDPWGQLPGVVRSREAGRGPSAPAEPPSPKPAPAPRQRAPRPRPAPKPRAPRPGTPGPGPDLAAQVDRQRQDLWARAREMGEQGGGVDDYRQLYDEVVHLVELLRQHHPAGTISRRFGDDLKRMESCVVQAEEPGITPRQRGARMNSCKAAAGLLAENLRVPFGGVGQ